MKEQHKFILYIHKPISFEIPNRKRRFGINFEVTRKTIYIISGGETEEKNGKEKEQNKALVIV